MVRDRKIMQLQMVSKYSSAPDAKFYTVPFMDSELRPVWSFKGVSISTWCRIKNRMHRYTSRGYFTPSIQNSGDYLKICGLGRTDGIIYKLTNQGTHFKSWPLYKV